MTFVVKCAFETWLSKSREKLGGEANAIDTSDWSTCPLAAKLRLFLSVLQNRLALLPVAGSTPKVTEMLGAVRLSRTTHPRWSRRKPCHRWASYSWYTSSVWASSVSGFPGSTC